MVTLSSYSLVKLNTKELEENINSGYLDNFSEDRLIQFWINQNEILGSEGEPSLVNLLDYVSKETKKNPEYLEKSRLAASEILKKSDAETVINIYDSIEFINNDFLNKIDLEKLLSENFENKKTSEKKINDYSIDIVNTANNSPFDYGKRKKFRDIFLDTPIGITLIYKDKPNAVVSFIPKDKNTFMIHQLQGVMPKIYDKEGKFTGEYKWHSRGLFGLDWQKLLVELCITVAEEVGYNKMGIKSGYNNHWLNEKGGIKIKAALKKYDGVAERLGFVQDKPSFFNFFSYIFEKGDWYKKIN